LTPLVDPVQVWLVNPAETEGVGTESFHPRGILGIYKVARRIMPLGGSVGGSQEHMQLAPSYGNGTRGWLDLVVAFG
jgi:hypothetical protein